MSHVERDSPAGPEPVPLDQLLHRTYQRFADRTAVVDDVRQLTYRELGTRARGVAATLRAMGAVPGDRIVLLAPNSVGWTEVDHACILGCFIRVAPVIRLHPRELARIVIDADPRLIVADADWLSEVGTEWVPAGVPHLITLDEVSAGTPALDDLAGHSDAARVPGVTTDPDAWLLYTSGSTGAPKGVRLSTKSLGTMVRNVLLKMPGTRAR